MQRPPAKHYVEWGGRTGGVKGIRDTTRTGPTEWTKWDPWGFAEFMHGFSLGPLHVVWLSSLVLWTPKSGSRGHLWLFCLVLGPFPLTRWSCPALIWWHVPGLVIAYMAYLVDVPGRPALFWVWRSGNGREGGRGNSSWGVLYERTKIKIKNKQKY